MGEIDYSTSHRLTNCPRCDYSLIGLPDSGICPECGQPYGTHEIFLYGTAMGTRQNFWNMYSAPIDLLGTLLGFTLIGAVFLLQGTPGFPMIRYFFHNPIWLVLVALFAAGYVVSIWRRFTDQGSGVVQIRLSPLGVHQGTRGVGPKPYDANMDAKLIPWKEIREAEFVLVDGHALIRLSTQQSFFRHVYEEHVHATFSCDRERFYDVKNYLRYWLSQNNCASALEFLEYRRRPVHRFARRLGLLLRGRPPQPPQNAASPSTHGEGRGEGT